MSASIELRTTPGYASQLRVVRECYRSGIEVWRYQADYRRDYPATNPYARAAGWRNVIETLQWSVTDDCAKGNGPVMDELALWRRLKTRESARRPEARAREFA